MVVIFNAFGLVWVVAAFAVAVGLQSSDILVGAEGNNFLEVLVFAVLFLDLGYRFLIGKNRYKNIENDGKGLKTDIGKHWLLGSKLGGSLMFLPAWATAILAYAWLKAIMA